MFFCLWCGDEHDREDGFCSPECKAEHFLMIDDEELRNTSSLNVAGNLVGISIAIVLPLGGVYYDQMSYVEALLVFLICLGLRSYLGCNMLIILLIGSLVYVCER